MMLEREDAEPMPANWNPIPWIFTMDFLVRNRCAFVFFGPATKLKKKLRS
jgi:hypothetical protein